MGLQSARRFVFGFWKNKAIEFEQIGENLSSDGGLIAFHQLDQKLGWTESFTDLISDPRSDPTHSALTIVRQRIFGIIAGYEDQNDHDSLRSDPVFKLIAERSPDGDDLASQPTISRLENFVTAGDLLNMQDWFIDRFVESFTDEPAGITLDIDTFDDPAHGDQQLVLFHGFYNQYSPKLAQELMRHSDINLTMKIYTHVDLPDKAAAVERLPTFPGTSPKQQRATGTDSVVAGMVAVKTGDRGSSQGLSLRTGDQKGWPSQDCDQRRNTEPEQALTKKGTVHKKEPPMRLELMTYALRKRRSAN